MIKHELNATESVWTRIARLRIKSIDLLAPRFQEAIEDALDEISGRSISIGSLSIPLDVIVFETLRTNELQEIYFDQGTSKAKTAEQSWHYYGLAIDVISKKYEWFGNAAAKAAWPDKIEREIAAEKWFKAVGGFFETEGCKLGSKWRKPDLPHIQWGKCSPTPLLDDIYLVRASGREAVWSKYDAA